MKLVIIIASTRPGRCGGPIGEWFTQQAKQHGAMEVAVADLAEINLPLLDEPNQPETKQYTKEHTRSWSRLIESADAFIVVTPEYNYFAPAPLINALDYLYQEWHYKPIAFVSYGGISGGMRSVQTIKQIVTTLKMVPLVEAVNVVGVTKHVGADGIFNAEQRHVESAQNMLNELHRWAGALQVLRKA